MPDQLTALEARIARLEKLALSEVTIPNYLTIGANGQVGATFTGVINALGITLPTAIGASAGVVQPQNSILWVRQSDGAVTAETNSRYNAGDGSYYTVEALSPSGSERAELDLVAIPTGGGAGAQLTARYDPVYGASRIFAQTDSQSVEILDGFGNSNFVQGYSPHNIGGGPQAFQAGNAAQMAQGNAPIGATGWFHPVYNTVYGASNDGPWVGGWYVTPATGIYLFIHQCGTLTPAGAGAIPWMTSGIGLPAGASFIGSISVAQNASASWQLGALCVALWYLPAGDQVGPWVYTNAGGTFLGSPYSYFGAIQLL